MTYVAMNLMLANMQEVITVAEQALADTSPEPDKERGALREVIIQSHQLLIAMRGLMQQFDSVEQERSALAAWACESCGARFHSSVPPGSLDGVQLCSACVTVQVLIRERDQAQQEAEYWRNESNATREAAANALADALFLIQPQVVWEARLSAEKDRTRDLITKLYDLYLALFPTYTIVSPEQVMTIIRREWDILRAKNAEEQLQQSGETE